MCRAILRLKIGQMQPRLTRDAVGKRKSTAVMVEVVVLDDTTPQIFDKAFHLALRSAGDVLLRLTLPRQ
jgi:hypothetical protein